MAESKILVGGLKGKRRKIIKYTKKNLISFIANISLENEPYNLLGHSIKRWSHGRRLGVIYLVKV